MIQQPTTVSDSRTDIHEDGFEVVTKNGAAMQKSRVESTTAVEQTDDYPLLLEKRLDELTQRIQRVEKRRGNVTEGLNFMAAPTLGVTTVFFIAGALSLGSFALIAGGGLLLYGTGMAINHGVARRELKQLKKEEDGVFNRLADYLKEKSQSMSLRFMGAQAALFGQNGKQQEFNAKSAVPEAANDTTPQQDAVKPAEPKAPRAT